MLLVLQFCKVHIPCGCCLGNIIQLAEIEKQQLSTGLVEFTVVVSRLLERCQKYVVNKKSNLTHWHPVLGWFSQKTDIRFVLFTLVQHR